MGVVRKSAARKSAQVGVAAVALGLSLAGPHLAVASADAPDDTSVAASSADGPAGAPASRGGAARSKSGATSRGDASTHPGVRRSSTPANPEPAATRAKRAAAATGPTRPAVAKNADAAPAAAAVRARTVDPTTVPLPHAGRTAVQEVATGETATPPAQAVQAGAAAAGGPATASATAPAAHPVPQGRIDQLVRHVLNDLGNFVVNLPSGNLASFLEGGLLMVRRSFFNLAPLVTPSPQTTSDTGQVSGRVGAFDEEGDPLSYTVSGDPQHGTVVVDGSGSYTYTPGSTYTGTDSFTVTIAPPSRSVNLLDWSGHGSRDVTIQIGNPTIYDNPDVAINLTNTAGHITVKRSLLDQFRATVTLTNVTDETQAVWLDTSGGFGGISVKQLFVNYKAFKLRAVDNGATVNLTLAYADADGNQQALVLNKVAMALDANGNYVFTGLVAPDPEIQTDAVDAWDVTGKAYKPMFDSFRKTYKLDKGQRRDFTTANIDFTGADFFADTITPQSYEQAGLYAQDSESKPVTAPSSSPVAPTPATPVSSTDGLFAAARTTLSAVTAELAVGQSVYLGRQDGSLEVWTDGQKTVLAPALAWGTNTSVSTLVRYDRVLKDTTGKSLANSFTGYIRGDELTVTALGPGSTVLVGSEISAPGVAKGTIITQFVPQNVAQASCNSSTNTCAGAAAGGVQGETGTYKVSIAQTVGSNVPTPGDQAGVQIPAGVVFTQKTLAGEDIPASAPAVIVGLSNGSLQMYSSSVGAGGVGTGGWTELHGFESGWGGVKSVIPYLDGFVVGLDNGYVRQWIGPTTNAAKGSNANDPSTWKNNWEDLYRPGTTQAPKYDGATMSAFNARSAITVMMPFRDRPDVCPGDSGKGACAGFLVGREDGSVLKYNEAADGLGKPGWQTLYDGSQNSPVVGIVEYKTLISGNKYLPSFAFAEKNGFIGEWKWQPTDDNGTQQNGKYGVERIQKPGAWGSGNEISSMAQMDRGFVVGLKNSSVQLRDANSNSWIELHDPGWGDNAVTTIIPFRSDGVTSSGKQGVIVGLSNGAIQAWTGETRGTKGGSPWGQNDWIQLHSNGWDSKVVAMAPAVGSAININGDAVTRDRVIVGFANGSVQQWSGTVTKGKPVGFISNGDQPSVFTGSISGTTLTVDQIDSGNITKGSFVVGGPTDGTKISDFITGSGGAGTYSVSQSQTWPTGGGSGTLSSGVGGKTLVLSLPAAYLSGGGLDPASLVGATVTGTNVAAGTKITSYDGTKDLTPGLAKYTVNNWSLVGAGPLTISGLGSDGERDWTELEGVPPPGLGPVPSLSDFTCDSNWRCGQGGTLQQAVEFGKQLAQASSQWSGNTSGFGTQTGVGSADDPIFGNTALYPYPTGGTTYTLAFSKELSPSALSYSLGDSKVAIDVNPLGYGYVVVPDGFFAKFKPGQWSLGVLVATEIGPSVSMQTSVTLPEKDLQLPSISTPGPLGFDSFVLSAGVKVSGDISVTGLGDKTAAVAHAYAVPGMLFTYNTRNSQGTVDVGFNYYLEADASDFKSLTGAIANANLTPYINLLYGIVVPPSIPLVGGWSLFSISGGFENPLTASLCVNTSNSCPTADSDTGANASITLGSSGALNFQAGLLDGITSALTYKKQIPLYQIPDYTKVIA